MRYRQFPTDFFVDNRKRFSSQLKPNALAVFQSNDLMPKTADQVYPFRQNSDLFYLSGIDQEESILVLFPDHPSEQNREMLFLRKTDEVIATWEGEKLTKEKATEISGIQTVFWLEDFDNIFPLLMNNAECCYVNLNEHDRYKSDVPYKDLRFARTIQSDYPGHHLERSAPIMKDLRRVKKDIEIQYIQKACDITKSAFERVLGFVEPGVWEYEIEAEITHEFIRNGSEGHSYDPIVASGKNACVLHYITNDHRCHDGDSILFDFGATYGNYASDMSRVIPVNGQFTARQKEVYNAVLRVFNQARSKLKPGIKLKEYQEEVAGLVEEELVKLNVLSRDQINVGKNHNPPYKRYFPHGVSHHMGLDVHDVPDRNKVIEPGMVFTCEPGIYIHEEGIGVRIENDLMVTENEPYDLMAHIPIEAEEIEELMQKRANNLTQKL